MKNILLYAFAVVCLVSCDSGNNGGSNQLSTGLKIFVTAEDHVGDFANDPTLNGANAIEKADDFCNQSLNKPNDSIYKALIVDGITRDALSLTDWVLQPSTTYYRPYNNIEIGKTSDAHIFTAYWVDLTNSIADCDYNCSVSAGFYVWTGIDDASNFSTSGSTCNSWSSSSNSQYAGRYGMFIETDGFAFSSNIFGSCGLRAYLYCVEQL